MKSPHTTDINTKEAGKNNEGRDFFFPKTKLGKPVTIRAKSLVEAEAELSKLAEKE
jgi:hypothetical protein